MTHIFISDTTKDYQLDVSPDATVLSAISQTSASITAPCGGRGTCGKCKVLVSEAGKEPCYVLACQTQVSEGMIVHLNRSRQMMYESRSIGSEFVCDATGTGLGVAVDIGTTTMVCRLYNLETGEEIGMIGQANPQGVFGADVISRISACTAGHQARMTELVNTAIQNLIVNLCEAQGKDTDAITCMVIAGNTVMQCLAAGLNPEPIGVAPFTCPSLFGDVRPFNLRGRNVDCLYVPCMAGYVGGDITAGVLAADMLETHQPALLLDLGTNGEMVLGNGTHMVSCATAAGPVFEGAGISCGMPAFPGAISKVSFDGESVQVETIGNEYPVGICGTGLVDAIALLLETGALDTSGYLNDEDEAPEAIAAYIGEVNGETAFMITPEVSVSQKDIRSYQLAMAAISAGIQVLLSESGLTEEDVADVYIAGGFGCALDVASAARTGLFPATLVHCAHGAGNTSLTGASKALLSAAAREALADIQRYCRYEELSTHAQFNEYYVSAMEFPE